MKFDIVLQMGHVITGVSLPHKMWEPLLWRTTISLKLFTLYILEWMF